MKKCSKCQLIKPKKDFYKHVGCKDGTRPDCKECHKKSGAKRISKSQKSEYDKLRYKENRQEVINRAAKWKKTDKGRIAARRSAKTQRDRHPEKYRARNAVYQAIKRGKIPHPSTLKCINCNKNAKQYHHHNGYGKKERLDVIPVCIKCHSVIHNELTKSATLL